MSTKLYSSMLMAVLAILFLLGLTYGLSSFLYVQNTNLNFRERNKLESFATQVLSYGTTNAGYGKYTGYMSDGDINFDNFQENLVTDVYNIRVPFTMEIKADNIKVYEAVYSGDNVAIVKLDSINNTNTRLQLNSKIEVIITPTYTIKSASRFDDYSKVDGRVFKEGIVRSYIKVG